MKKLLLTILCLATLNSFSQELKLKKRLINSLSGSEFANSIADTTLSILNREEIIYKNIKAGNVPLFLRKFESIALTKELNGKTYTLIIEVLPDYLAIGIDKDYFYVPTTPMLAQRIANFTKTMLPTKFLVDKIYEQAKIKLAPQPIPASKAMTTVAIFNKHNELIKEQMQPFKQYYANRLTAGNKKDIIISNKIYGETNARVVIYGWHKLDGKAIQPVYNKHTNMWADYSHGVRLLNEKAILNGNTVYLKDLLKDRILHQLVSDEGQISKPYYPIK